MTVKNHVFKSNYRDSVSLMRLSKEIEGLDGVVQATAIMGTANNKELLSVAGLLDDTGKTATANDLIVALDLTSGQLEARTLASVRQHLSAARQGVAGGTEYRPRSLEGAVQTLPQANLALISVPGAYATREARKALDLGLHVLLFSDNVPLEDEVELKQRAVEQGLFMLGPDCGTAIINGVPLGFANAVPSGRVGLVSASGSGLQQVACLLAESGEGISHGLGVGGRDLSGPVGGAMMLEGLRALHRDPATEVVVLISKPPSVSARDRVLAAIGESPKPTVVAFLGETGTASRDPNIFFEATLEDTARRAAELLGGEVPAWSSLTEENWQRLRSLSPGLETDGRYIRGLYSGGTLCYEALLLLREFGHRVHSNLESTPGEWVGGAGHMVVDLGDGQYTVGRPHPMIDFRTRCNQLVQEATSPQMGVLLLDVILGYGSHPYPASELAPALREAQRQSEGGGRSLACIVVICGAPDDPQGFAQQEQTLAEAGAVVVHSNALAVRIASAFSKGDLSALPRR